MTGSIAVIPEAPDFNTIALRLLVEVDTDAQPTPSAQETRHAMAVIAEQLRLIWNARGAADLAELEHAHAGAQPTMKVLARVIGGLDR